jgi:hypothetical protein
MTAHNRPRLPVSTDPVPEERLLDDAIDDTFPASDPVALGVPGSSVYLRYAERARHARRARQWEIAGWAAVTGAAVTLALLLLRKRLAPRRWR